MDAVSSPDAIGAHTPLWVVDVEGPSTQSGVFALLGPSFAKATAGFAGLDTALHIGKPLAMAAG